MNRIKRIKILNEMFNKKEIDIDSYFEEMAKIKLTKIDYVNNINKFYENLKNEKFNGLFNNEKINHIIKESINLLINDNILIPKLPVFLFSNKTISINEELTYDEIISYLNDNKLVFLYEISKEDYVNDNSIVYRCAIHGNLKKFK